MNHRRFGLYFARTTALAALLAIGWRAAAANPGAPANEPQPELLTNLLQLRHCAAQGLAVVHPIRIVASVLYADSGSGVLVLRDASDVEFIQLPFHNRDIEPGATVCLEGNGCAVQPKGYGLAIVPRLVVDNDGRHGTKTESGTRFLNAGLNPIVVQWFNGLGDFSLDVEYKGPGLPRQQIPASVLWRADVDSATDVTNFVAGLDYRCCEGDWEFVPDFAELPPAKTGVVTNFDLGVRTRNIHVGLQFNGFIEIPRDGLYTFYVSSDDGSRLLVGQPSLDVHVLSNGPVPVAIEKVPSTAGGRKGRLWAALEGTVEFVGHWITGGELQMRVGHHAIRVQVFKDGSGGPSFSTGTRVRVSGIYQDLLTEDGDRVPGLLLAPCWKAIHAVHPPETRSTEAIVQGENSIPAAAETDSMSNTMPILTTAADIKALTPELAKQRLPVSIRGVVIATIPASQGAVIQDPTKGVFVSLQNFNMPESVKLGEYCQVQGVTDPGLFAPLVVARQITDLGAGQFPQPVRANRDQLEDGSLDTQYVEIEGVVTATHDQQIDMMMEGGHVELSLYNFRPEVLAGYEDALVRVRGCLFGPFNGQTHEVEGGPLNIADASVEVLQAPPRDLFNLPQKSIGELLLYNPKAGPFVPVKVSGQIIHAGAREYFLSDGSNGLLVRTRNSTPFAVGDLVETVGYVRFGGPIVGLTEAVMRKIGSSPLPAPTKLASKHLLESGYSGMLVQVDARLMNQLNAGGEYLLELQSGFLTFRAQLDSHGQLVRLPPPGSRLELTGVYAPQGNGSAGEAVGGFELLLNSPANIRVLSTPPWWTLKRVLFLAGTLAVLLCVALIWNKQLHRLVQERTRKLELEIRSRQQAEMRHAAEAERSRIARDLHDDLGAGLTEMSLLASAGLGEFKGIGKIYERLGAIAEKARTLVSGLDVIVWAIDPKRNSLQSFADYAGSYAKEILSAKNIVCHLNIPLECEGGELNGGARHSLFLAVKEALNNVIRHASATEVELQMTLFNNWLKIVIADNGSGFDYNTIRPGDGLSNLHERLEALRGECQIESQPGKGTTVKLIVPLNNKPG